MKRHISVMLLLLMLHNLSTRGHSETSMLVTCLERQPADPSRSSYPRLVITIKQDGYVSKVS